MIFGCQTRVLHAEGRHPQAHQGGPTNQSVVKPLQRRRLADRDVFSTAHENNLPVLTYILSALAILWIVTVEIDRIKTGWSGGLITLWWAASAFTLIITGLVRRRAYMRYLGLAVIGVTVLKVFFVDTAGLHGLERIGAFFGVGMLMLILSYAYQRVAPKLLAGGEPEHGE